MPNKERQSAIYLDCTELTRSLIDANPTLVPEGLEIHVGDPDDTNLRRLLEGRSVVLNGHTTMSRQLMQKFPELRTIIFLGTGPSSYIDLDAATELGIAVETITGYGDRSIAEHTLALLFAAARRITEMDRTIRSGAWHPLTGVELADQTLGVIGLGGVGREMVHLAAALGMNVIAWNRSPLSSALPCQLIEDLDALLQSSDAVTLHLALTDDTRGILSRERLRRMKSSAILVNTARGALVDEDALVMALSDGELAQAALDVYAMEPLPKEHPLTTLPNVILSAHAAFKTPAANRRLIERGLAIARSVLEEQHRSNR